MRVAISPLVRVAGGFHLALAHISPLAVTSKIVVTQQSTAGVQVSSKSRRSGVTLRQP